MILYTDEAETLFAERDVYQDAAETLLRLASKHTSQWLPADYAEYRRVRDALAEYGVYA